MARFETVPHKDFLDAIPALQPRPTKRSTMLRLVPQTCRKLFAAARYNLLNPNFGGAALCGVSANCNRIAGLDGALRPTNPGQTIGTGELTLPFLGRSGIVLGFPKDLYMWVDEIKCSDHSLYGNRLAGIIVRRSVVR